MWAKAATHARLSASKLIASSDLVHTGRTSMARGQSPLVGYNTNVRHKGKLYHIQTEDSGVQHPHIITHLFADGGRIVASKKTDYAQHISTENLHDVVKKLMQDQHKAMFIALRDCVYDEDEKPGAAAAANAGGTERAARHTDPPELDLDALERAAEAHLSQSAAANVKPVPRQRSGGRYQQAVPAQQKPSVRPDKRQPNPEASIFNGQVLRGKSLDEVILSYLADDAGEER
jgi:uncharacterized protein YcfJ